MKRNLLFLACCMFSYSLAAEELTADATPPPIEESLPTGVVARINGIDIPADWFTHEFRSTFFRHQQANDVRQLVFSSFLNRMLLAAKAREMKLDQDPEIQREIDRRISGMRAYLEYQLAMTEIGILNSALIQKLGLDTEPSSVTDEEVAAFFEQNIKGKPGAPASVTQIPAGNLDGIRSQVAQSRVEKALVEMIGEWAAGMSILVNSSVVENVKVPEMKGPVPTGIERPIGPIKR